MSLRTARYPAPQTDEDRALVARLQPLLDAHADEVRAFVRAKLSDLDDDDVGGLFVAPVSGKPWDATMGARFDWLVTWHEREMTVPAVIPEGFAPVEVFDGERAAVCLLRLTEAG